MIRFARVDLPHPDSPTTPRTSPVELDRYAVDRVDHPA
jgi:hypothetical protein